MGNMLWETLTDEHLQPLQDQSTVILPFTPIPIYQLQTFVTFKLDLAGESTL